MTSERLRSRSVRRRGDRWLQSHPLCQHACAHHDALTSPQARETLGAIPCSIVQGRHDVLCPPYTARALHAAWPGSALRIVEAGAHALFEKPMRTAVQVIAIECR